MAVTEDLIVDISEAREKFFGCSGKMLIPCPATVAALIREVPRDRLLTTDQLRQELAERHGAQVTCPAATNHAFKVIAQTANDDVPYWRVIKKNGELIAHFSGGAQNHAALLANDGFTVDTAGKAPKVKGFKEKLTRFD